jgi:two-component system, CitB family, response regulator DctR
MTDWRVLIVEDDEQVASIHRRIVAAHPGFQVTAVASSSEQALTLIRRGVPIDLVLLDIGLPGADGTRLLRVLRSQPGPEVIAVTAARDPKVVQTLLHLGVLDYLVKPFAVERLQEALLRFRDRKRTLGTAKESLGQGDIDTLYGQPERNLLPKGLQPGTLEAIRVALRGAGDQFLSAEQVAQRAAVARVTARRYLEYLATARQVQVEPYSDGPGRPRKMYRLVPVPG